MTLIIFTLVSPLCAKLVVCMASAKVLTLVHVILDGRVTIATSALPCLAVFMVAVMVPHWHVHVTTLLNGQEVFVISRFAMVVV